MTAYGRGSVVLALLALASCDVSRPVRVGDDAGPPCPTLPRDLSLDSTCEGRRCVVATRQEGCTFQLTVSTCMSDVFAGRVGADGALSFNASESLGVCTPVGTRSEALHSFECATPHGLCHYDLYGPAPRSPLTVETVSLVSSPFTAPPDQEVEPLEDFDPTTGYIADLRVLPGAVWVATRAGSFGTLECEEPERAELVRIDPEQPAVTTVEMAPPCLALLAPDTSGLGELLGVTAGRAPRLHRFDAQGKVVATTDVPPPALPMPTDDLVPVGLFTDSSTVVALLLTTLQRPGAAWLVTLDARTLAHRATSTASGAQLRASTGIVRQRVYASDRHNAAIQAFDVAGTALALREMMMVQPARGSSDDAGFVYFHAPSERVLVSSTGRRAALWALDPSLQAPGRRAFAYEAEMVPWAITAWPGDDDRVAVGAMVAPPSFAAMLATYSLAENRFLPGATRIGQGVVGALAVDAKGRLWASLPWSGQVVRITLGGP